MPTHQPNPTQEPIIRWISNPRVRLKIISQDISSFSPRHRHSSGPSKTTDRSTFFINSVNRKGFVKKIICPVLLLIFPPIRHPFWIDMHRPSHRTYRQPCNLDSLPRNSWVGCYGLEVVQFENQLHSEVAWKSSIPSWSSKALSGRLSLNGVPLEFNIWVIGGRMEYHLCKARPWPSPWTVYHGSGTRHSKSRSCYSITAS